MSPRGSLRVGGFGSPGGFHPALGKEDLVRQRSCRLSISKNAGNVLMHPCPTQVLFPTGNRRQISETLTLLVPYHPTVGP